PLCPDGGQQLHADAKPEDGSPRRRHRQQGLAKAAPLDVLDGAAEMSNPRQHQMGVVLEPGGILDDLDVDSVLVEGVGDGSQIAHAIVDDTDQGRVGSHFPINVVQLPSRCFGSRYQRSKSHVLFAHSFDLKSGECGGTTVLATILLNWSSVISRYSRNSSSEGGFLPSNSETSRSASAFSIRPLRRSMAVIWVTRL